MPEWLSGVYLQAPEVFCERVPAGHGYRVTLLTTSSSGQRCALGPADCIEIAQLRFDDGDSVRVIRANTPGRGTPRAIGVEQAS
ncbi:MAG: hypothetical protein IT337_08185 [Thermomicrobiales bacterium]|nr:hypothetical protein [Thermomicrobiales bacterium]